MRRSGEQRPRPASEAEPPAESPQTHGALLESALQCIEEGVVIVDLEGRFLFVNRAAERIVGLGAVESSPSEWASTYGTFLPDKVTPYPSDQLPLARALRGEHVSEEELLIRNAERPEGIWISVSSSPLKDPGGELRGGVIVFRDVTAHRQSREVVDRLSQAVERTTDSVFITDANAIIESVNPAFEETTGFAREQAVGQPASILKSGLQPPAFYEALWKRILAGEVHSGTLVNRRRDGHLFHAEQTITPVRDPSGNLTHFVSVMRDITELKKAEEREVEMRLARTVQQKLYPSGPPSLSRFDLAGAAFPADHTCGDYYDFIPTSDGRVGIAVGDVSGHGFGAALLMAETRAFLRSLLSATTDPGTVMRQLNVLLCRDTEDERFVTLLLALLDPEGRSLVYCSAGHIPGYVLDASGRVRSTLGSTGAPLGFFEDAVFEPCGDVSLRAGDLLLMLTDGATEAQNEKGEFFEAERVLQVVAREREKRAAAIVERLRAAIGEFAPEGTQRDDITAVVGKVGG